MDVEYETKCGNCNEHEETENDWQIYCKRYKQYFNKDESCSYQQRINRSEESSNCYITTIVCNLVGFSDDCKILKELRAFRNKMQQDPKYREILFEYDSIGPKIAENLMKYKEFDLANGMLDAYIFPTVSSLREGKEEEAVKKYLTMTRALEDYYGIKPEEIVPTNYDQKNGGHGKVLTI